MKSTAQLRKKKKKIVMLTCESSQSGGEVEIASCLGVMGVSITVKNQENELNTKRREEEGIDEWSGKSWAFGEEDDKNFRQQRLLPSRFAFALKTLLRCSDSLKLDRLLFNVLICCNLHSDDKVTELEAEKRAWESSPEAKAIKEALNPWRNQDAEPKRNS
nr:DNA mismatch repair protein [Ipomoea batatas]